MRKPGDTLHGLWEFFSPPDPSTHIFVDPAHSTPERFEEAEEAMKALRNWRWKVTASIILLFGFVIWAVMPEGLAHSSTVDQKIQQALRPIQDQLHEMTKSTKELTLAVNEQVAISTANTICRLLQRQTRESDLMEKRRIRTEIDTAQDQYKSIKGVEYPEIRCEN